MISNLSLNLDDQKRQKKWSMKEGKKSTKKVKIKICRERKKHQKEKNNSKSGETAEKRERNENGCKKVETPP